MKSGPRPGAYKQSEEKKEKIRKSRLGKKHSVETREKISETMSGRNRSSETKDKISNTLLDLENEHKCLQRFEELKATYPEEKDFFEENQVDIIDALKDIKSEKEMDSICKHIENQNIERWQNRLSYQYSSSSIYAQEDLMISLLDTALFLSRFQ